jgi:anaerobic selenocysteine-containing dehydrogenase
MAIEPEQDLVLIGRRQLRSANSWLHNVEVLVKGKERCTLQINPDDAARIGLEDGATATIASAIGKLDVAVEITADISRGVVSIPYGWGHKLDGAKLSVAEVRPGVNTNILTDSSQVDPLSGNAVLNGIPVTVSVG